MSPRQLITASVEAFNRGNADEIAAFHAEDAVNHQVVQEPVIGRPAIRDMFAREFAAAEMVCIPERMFEDGEWAILEWRDPLRLRGCGFHVHERQDPIRAGVLRPPSVSAGARSTT